ncbi:uncharacterized protein LOC114261540 isoform X2 [Camellia sinensis]|uniref:uncharacterized protein LOC114261540 isoform X2 n=1 Tax=Camellia sinensis TaxID=4442 RepID=UPI00103602A4|nr:uncharacterized protein LOC114261540 isoform X2 [Camellia sinensis]
MPCSRQCAALVHICALLFFTMGICALFLTKLRDCNIYGISCNAGKEVLVKTKLCCEFLSRRRDPSAIICHNSAPELEILMDKKIKEQSNTIPYLPEELIINILMRLHVMCFTAPRGLFASVGLI